MKIEAGKFYKTRDGQKVGPMTRTHDGLWEGPWPITSGSGKYPDDGTKYIGMTHEYDLVSEWHDGPVRTVTRREIVGGTYGCVEVDVHSFGMNVVVDFSGGKCTPEELREAAHILNQLAEVLEENK